MYTALTVDEHVVHSGALGPKSIPLTCVFWQECGVFPVLLKWCVFQPAPYPEDALIVQEWTEIAKLTVVGHFCLLAETQCLFQECSCTSII